MNWEALGAIGEIVGAVALVVTLGYLALQIRQNTQVLRSATHPAWTYYGHGYKVVEATFSGIHSAT